MIDTIDLPKFKLFKNLERDNWILTNFIRTMLYFTICSVFTFMFKTVVKQSSTVYIKIHLGSLHKKSFENQKKTGFGGF